VAPGPVRGPGDPQLLLWSATDAPGEERVRRALLRYVSVCQAEPVGLSARSLARKARRDTAGGNVRGAVVAGSATELAGTLQTYRAAPSVPGRGFALLFPGQGAQYPRMAAGLYGHEPVFTAAMDAVFTVLGERGTRLRAEWLSGDEDVPLDDGTRAQPLLFAVGYALGRMVLGWGVRPTALLGHSVGELVAATLAGVFSLPDAVRMMNARIGAVVATPPGGMLAVAAGAQELLPYLGHPDVAVAASTRRARRCSPGRTPHCPQWRLNSSGRGTCAAGPRRARRSTAR
jgi:acyl transferase domain-containing protein